MDKSPPGLPPRTTPSNVSCHLPPFYGEHTTDAEVRARRRPARNLKPVAAGLLGSAVALAAALLSAALLFTFVEQPSRKRLATRFHL
jgi:hypothetical protein